MRSAAWHLTCLGSQHEGCVPFFVLLVHIKERTAAKQGHNTLKAVVACNHEACLGKEQLRPCAFLGICLGPRCLLNPHLSQRRPTLTPSFPPRDPSSGCLTLKPSGCVWCGGQRVALAALGSTGGSSPSHCCPPGWPPLGRPHHPARLGAGQSHCGHKPGTGPPDGSLG